LLKVDAYGGTPSNMAQTGVEIKAQNTSVIPKDTLKHFTTVPIAQPTLQDPDFRCLYASRTVTDDGKGHTLMGKTWATETTIPHLLSLYRTSDSSSSDTPNVEIRRFYTLGGDLNAHPDLLHGGVISCILDSTLGNAVGIGIRHVDITSMYTVQLNVKYESPVRTPGTIVARSWIRKVEVGEKNVKVWAEGIIESLSGDRELVVHSKAEGIWVGKKGKRKANM
jgi:acyl-coenzyme A thioesterase PaaI-like protein